MHRACIELVKSWAKCPNLEPRSTLASGFRHLHDYGIANELLQVLEGLGAVKLAINQYLEGGPKGFPLGQIARMRTGIQSCLLLLPSAVEISMHSVHKPNMYECTRLAAMIYGAAVIFPLPNITPVLRVYVGMLKVAIQCSFLEAITTANEDISNVYLWILILGATAALNEPERPWFISYLVVLLHTKKLAWSEVEVILESFLWLDSACGVEGRRLWNEIELLI